MRFNINFEKKVLTKDESIKQIEKQAKKLVITTFLCVIVTVFIFFWQLQHAGFNTKYDTIVKINGDYDKQVIFKQLARMDDKTLKNLKIVIDSDNPVKDMTKFNNNSYTCGWYDPLTNVISLFCTNNAEYNVIHEIGHKVWYKDLNDSQRQRWKYYYIDGQIGPSMYSFTNIEENFAENYACFWYDKSYSRLMFHPNGDSWAVRGQCIAYMDKFPRSFIQNLSVRN